MDSTQMMQSESTIHTIKLTFKKKKKKKRAMHNTTPHIRIQQVEAKRNMIFNDRIRPPQPIPNPCFSPRSAFSFTPLLPNNTNIINGPPTKSDYYNS